MAENDFYSALGLYQNASVMKRGADYSTPKATYGDLIAGGQSISNIPTAASTNPTIGTIANTSDKNPLISSQTWEATMQLTAGGINAANALMQGNWTAKALRAQAKANLTQIGYNNQALVRKKMYLAEENLSVQDALTQERNEMLGAQSAAIGASGFDVSAGEQRVFIDTEVKYGKDFDTNNRTTYCAAVEMERETMLENARLAYEAKLLKSQAKYAKKMARVSAVGSFISGLARATGSYIGSSGKNITVDGKVG